MEQPLRSSLSNSEMYLMFDSHHVYLYVGHQCDSLYLSEIFEVYEIQKAALNRTEE